MDSLKFSVRCVECGDEYLQVCDPEMLEGILTFTVNAHECVPATARLCSLTDALEATESWRVEVCYWKKDGSFRTLTGYFPKYPSTERRVGYALFMEENEETDEFDYKNLLRKNITSIRELKGGFTHTIAHEI